jgi:VIT1/CCC1 family predicted Fe2+/Mn2+ transporter
MTELNRENEFRAAILSASDGLLTTALFVITAIGANLSNHAIIVSGLAGVVAGSISMSLGEFQSTDEVMEGCSPYDAALSALFTFLIGASIPILPFFFLSGISAGVVSALCSGMALFAVGTAVAKLNGKPSPYKSGLRQLAFGIIAAGLTYGIGYLFGVSIN